MTRNITNQFSSENPSDEARRLALEIEELRTRLDYLMEFDAEDDAENWNVWPYSWAIAGWNQARSCFHSFHQKRNEATQVSFEGACPLRLI